MLDPDKFINKRMTKEDLSLLFLSGDVLKFKSREQFENWLFVLNFPLISPFIKVKERDAMQVAVVFDLPFAFSIASPGSGKFEYKVDYPSKAGDVIKVICMVVGMSHPEARLLIKAGRS